VAAVEALEAVASRAFISGKLKSFTPATPKSAKVTGASGLSSGG
jgi:hypothetical protein